MQGLMESANFRVHSDNSVDVSEDRSKDILPIDEFFD
jgi:hypothetical protein